MSARIPSRRLGQSALTAIRLSPTHWIGTTTPPLTSRRTLIKPLKRLLEDPEPSLENPLLEKYLRKIDQKGGTGPKPPAQPKQGKLSGDTVFKPEYEHNNPRPDTKDHETLKKWEAEREKHKKAEKAQKDYELSQLKLDPDPQGRKRWERKMVIRSLQKRGRLTKEMKLKRTERQSLYKSHSLPASVKKLTKIINQIAGKTVEEALVQLRFSKKKVARDVWKGLQIARDEAIVSRGMGLGAAHKERTEGEVEALKKQRRKEKQAEQEFKDALKQWQEATKKASSEGRAIPSELRKNEDTEVAEVVEPEDQVEDPNTAEQEKAELQKLEEQLTLAQKTRESLKLKRLLAKPKQVLLPDGTRTKPKDGKATLIELKDGKTKRIQDPTELYVDQAWVGRGEQWHSPEFRARGRVNMLTHRTTSFSVLLKEEKTRMRISEEIKKKRDNRKLWVALPDRPITSQRQYCLW